MLSTISKENNPSEGVGVDNMSDEKWKAEWEKKCHNWVAHMLELTYPEPFTLDKTVLSEKIGKLAWEDLPEDVKSWFIASAHCIG